MAFSLKRGRDKPALPSGQSEGAMTLIEHLRELRSRLFKAVAAIVVTAIACGFFYYEIFEFLQRPFEGVVSELAAEEGLEAELTLNGVADPLTLALKVSLVSGIVLSSPIWLWQVWAFIVPGLHANERRKSMIFAVIAGPLFMTGVALGYYVLPKGLEILLDFTPADVANLVEVGRYLSFILRMLLVFGIAFEIPLFVIMLNLAGVVSGKQLGEARPWIIIATFVFAAVATPSTDPVSMLFLALPMTGLFILSEVIARLLDRRRGVGAEGDYNAYDDDETSDLALEDHDETASDLDDDDDWDDDRDDDSDDLDDPPR
ncbi:MAG: twin-arginine translocase subunit TatC [Nocardioidaceae bacterium]